MDYFVKAIPFFFLLIGVEFCVGLYRRKTLFSLPDSINNLSLGTLQELVSIFFTGVMLAGYIYTSEHFAIAHLQPSPLTWLGVLLGVDFCYYWFHRASHRIAFFWAFHVVHHQSEEYNLTVALRQSAFGGFVSWLFYLPLAVAGFSTEMFVASYSFNLLYQFWIHTRAIRSLGPLEWVLNTPAHHRVHHGRNPKYIDKNYAGALIIWDRLFGTFQQEEEEPIYGIVHPLHSWNPVWANFHVWVELANSARKARSPWEAILCFTMPPGWDPSLRGKPMPPVNPDLSIAKYEAQCQTFRGNAYVAANFVVLLLISAVYFNVALTFPFPLRLAVGAFILLSLLALGGLFERKRWAYPSEGLRLLCLVAGIAGVLYLSSVHFSYPK